MKRKNEKSDNIWDKIIKTLWYLYFVFMVVILVIVSTTIKGHCADGESIAYFPMGQNDNGFFTESILSDIDTIYDSENNYIFVKYDRTDNYGRKYFQVITTPKTSNGIPIFAELLTDGYRFSIYYIGSPSITYYGIRFDPSGDYYSSGTVNFNTFQNLQSSLYSSTAGYVSNFRLYTNNTDNRSLVLSYGSDEPIIYYGHATPPEEFHNPFFNPNSHAQPPEEVPPQVTINNYTWNTYNPPLIDDTDIISTIKSLIYVVNYLMGWLKDNISGEFQNLLSNLKGFFDYIGQTIQYYGGLIIDNIQNLITTFYNNMVSLVEDIAEKIGYISEPFDSSALIDAFENMQIYDDYDRCGQLIDDAFGFFDDIYEPNSFTIPIDLRGISILHQNQILYFDLGWINSAKSIIRAFMWTVTTFGLLYTVIDSIPDYIQGQDE